MPKKKQPITERPNAADYQAKNAAYHGKHRETDEALPGRGGTKGGLNKVNPGGSDGRKQNLGLPKGNSGKTRGSTRQRS